MILLNAGVGGGVSSIFAGWFKEYAEETINASRKLRVNVMM